MISSSKRIAKNTFMLYMMTFAKMFLSILTLPYLTRVLSTDCYGTVSYVKSVMAYMQIIIDFGFMLSATKDITVYRNDSDRISEICSTVIWGKIILSIVCFIGTVIMSFFVQIIRKNFLYSVLSLFAIVLTAFIPDFLFKGLERMEIISVRFIITKSISTILTLMIVKNDNNILLIPLLDIIGNLVAIIWTYVKSSQLGFDLRIRFIETRKVIICLSESFSYFVSSFASTILGGFSTIIMGACLSSSDVAYWSVANNLISTIQSLYSPISDSIYPVMIRTKNLIYIKKIFIVFFPLVIIGTVISYFFAPQVVLIVAGDKYEVSALLFRIMLPVLIISFLTYMSGWPVLGCIEKTKEIMISTVASAGALIVMYILFILFHSLNLFTVAFSKIISEIIISAIRILYVFKFRNCFVVCKNEGD